MLRTTLLVSNTLQRLDAILCTCCQPLNGMCSAISSGSKRSRTHHGYICHGSYRCCLQWMCSQMLRFNSKLIVLRVKEQCIDGYNNIMKDTNIYDKSRNGRSSLMNENLIMWVKNKFMKNQGWFETNDTFSKFTYRKHPFLQGAEFVPFDWVDGQSHHLKNIQVVHCNGDFKSWEIHLTYYCMA